MEEPDDISVIIPTYNRRDLVCRAVESALHQTHPPTEIIVVDDGSTDGTAEALGGRYGSRIRVLRQQNRGVSAARNHGLRSAQGRYIALLDSDDEWLPEKTRVQRDWLEQHSDYGMVLCDVIRTDKSGAQRDILRRRLSLPEDGWIMRWVLLNPALVPSSVLMRREVIESIGLFDEALATGEDLDFHLRVARSWKIGVVSQPLTRAIRGHDGLSSLSRTVEDYIDVMERACAASAGCVPDVIRRQALSLACIRAANDYVYARNWAAAWAMICRFYTCKPDLRAQVSLLNLIPLAARRLAVAALHAERGRLSPTWNPK